MVVLHSSAETYTFSFFPHVVVPRVATLCVDYQVVHAIIVFCCLSYDDEYLVCVADVSLSSNLHVLSSLLETPPFRVVKSVVVLLLKF
jgi:hypothetical protein